MPWVGGFRDEVAERLFQPDFKRAVVHRLHSVYELERARARLDDAFGRILPALDGVDYVINTEGVTVVPFG